MMALTLILIVSIYVYTETKHNAIYEQKENYSMRDRWFHPIWKTILAGFSFFNN